MIAFLQRVNWAQVKIAGQSRARIDRGLLVLLGIEREDTRAMADKLLHKLLNYRVFADEQGRMNKSLLELNAELLMISQFTLAATTDKGLRPGFSSAMAPQEAEQLYDYTVHRARAMGVKIQTGVFGADMQVGLENDGPVSFYLRV